MTTPSPSYTTLPGSLKEENPFADRYETASLAETATTTITTTPFFRSSPSQSVPFNPTIHLQIETPGKPLLSLPSPPRPDPIPIFSVTNNSTPSSLKFVSIRPSRSSGSCFLTSPPSSSHSISDNENEEQVPLSTTTYRFGPGRHPIIRLFRPNHNTTTTNHTTTIPIIQQTPQTEPWTHPENEQGINLDQQEYDTFQITSQGLLTRSVSFKTRLGTFTWRYASRSERTHLYPASPITSTTTFSPTSISPTTITTTSSPTTSPTSISLSPSSPTTTSHKPPNSLLIMEKITTVATAGGGKETIKRTVAHLIRGEGTRARGSKSSCAGNGGLLCIDLGGFGFDGRDGDGEEKEMGIVMVVTTVLVMLKREVDRRRAQQVAVMAAVLS
ncbi:hypothetical protein QBC47DRAFT_128042 [Echria macrotheca]|uniref:Uncharacterized protein n=1 Tax=Echria macrotheca TaxID=438768 RepID=A0AAJ0B421_9PEZI|nr:hypothetical protein QBC47DRAFT_128042 [Echria macrotheca]